MRTSYIQNNVQFELKIDESVALAMELPAHSIARKIVDTMTKDGSVTRWVSIEADRFVWVRGNISMDGFAKHFKSLLSLGLLTFQTVNR